MEPPECSGAPSIALLFLAMGGMHQVKPSYHPIVPGLPLNGPVTCDVIHPP
jgi:hypothetical protein